MNNDKKIIAITQGDANGVGLELILKTFAEPDMLEMCTPIIYGQPKMAAYCAKTLEIAVPINAINDAEEAVDGKLNVIQTQPEDMRMEFGTATEESARFAFVVLQKALSDAFDGKVDAVVVGPANPGQVVLGDTTYVNTTQFVYSHAQGHQLLPVYINNVTTILGLNSALTDVDKIQLYTTKFNTVLKRNMLLSNPRVALLAGNDDIDEEQKKKLYGVFSNLVGEGVQAFGPYKAEEFFAARHYDAFDGVIATDAAACMKAVNTITDVKGMMLYAGLPFVCIQPSGDAQMSLAGTNTADESGLRTAIYSSIDFARNTERYDEARRNPLQKLYKERPDSGEKLRFSVAKKKAE